MAVENVPLLAFNRGLVSKHGLARVDIKRTALSAEVFTNWIARVLGSMMLRPGSGWLGNTRADAKPFYLEFVFSLTDKALVELTDQNLRIWINDAVLQRVAVATAVTNGNFAADVAGWTDNDEAGAVSAWSGAFGGSLSLQGTGTNAAIRDQQVVVAAGDLGKEHALRIVIERGPVTLRIGNALGDDTYINETVLDTGSHSLALTPSTDIWIRFFTRRIPLAFVGQCTIEAAGDLVLPTPWLAADLPRIRYDTSGDIIFIACKGTYQQRAIERRAAHSWSIVLYQPEDGPFLVENIGPITLTPSTITGDTTVIASKALFRTSHVGALFRITSVGQDVIKVGAALNDATDAIRVTGVGSDRAITIILSGFFDGVRTIILERSFDNAAWSAVPGETWIAAITVAFTDGLDNQIVFYRLRISVIGGAGNTNMELSIPTGSITGVVRVTAFVSTVNVSVQVLKALGGTSATAVWAEGTWSIFRGYPSAVGFHSGRLCWAGKGFLWGSISDGFYSFDDTVEGDSGTFARSIGSGPVDNINWILGLQRLLLGADMAEQQAVTSSLDEPITPINFGIRPASTQGSHLVAGQKIDTHAIFAARGGTRVFDLGLDPTSGDYVTQELTAIVPDLFEDEANIANDLSIVRLGVQRKPDTRIHAVRADGTVAIAIFDRLENVICWLDYETDGDVEDVVILPGTVEDQVYYAVKRTINSVTKRSLERWALEVECRGAAVTKLADAFILYQGPAIAHVPVAHLEGKQVVVWADGVDVGYDDDDNLIYTVTGGFLAPDLSVPASTIVVGLPYMGKWQSAKLAYAAQLGTALNQKKKVDGLGVIMRNTHARGLKYGPDFDTLDPLPQIEDGGPVDPDYIWPEYDKASFEFPGEWDTDSRICLQAMAPRACTLLALTGTVETNEKQ